MFSIFRQITPVSYTHLAPVLVQGESAPEQLVRAVNKFSASKIADVVTVNLSTASPVCQFPIQHHRLAADHTPMPPHNPYPSHLLHHPPDHAASADSQNAPVSYTHLDVYKRQL